MLDENEFLSPYGIRSLSRQHLEHPFVFHLEGHQYKVQYSPAESDSGMFGGNSNWRGPVWMPVNVLLIRGLLNLYQFYGDDFKVECPTGSGKYMTLFEVAREIGNDWPASFCSTPDGDARSMGERGSFKKTPIGKITFCSTSIFTGTMAPGLEPATKPDGPGS